MVVSDQKKRCCLSPTLGGGIRVLNAVGWFGREADAAILFDVCERFVERRIIWRTANHPPLSPLVDQSCRDQPAQMKGEGRGGHPEARLYFAYGEPIRTGADQKPDDLKARQVAEFGEASRGCLDVHVRPYNRPDLRLQL